MTWKTYEMMAGGIIAYLGGLFRGAFRYSVYPVTADMTKATDNDKPSQTPYQGTLAVYSSLISSLVLKAKVEIKNTTTTSISMKSGYKYPKSNTIAFNINHICKRKFFKITSCNGCYNLIEHYDQAKQSKASVNYLDYQISSA